jgi:hypothetical protein
MSLPMPSNGDDSSYLAVAVLGELLSTLIKKGLLSDEDINALTGAAIAKLQQTPNSSSERAASLLAKSRANHD